MQSVSPETHFPEIVLFSMERGVAENIYYYSEYGKT